jgi:monothiol glutaredoxin
MSSEFELELRRSLESPKLRHTPSSDERDGMKTLNEQISDVIQQEPVAVFMKGTPQMVMCGNSHRALQALHAAGAPITAVDILPDPRIRQELATISGWPTIPQVFVKGELVGGADITEELAASGELQQKLDDALGADRAQDVKVVELQLA